MTTANLSTVTAAIASFKALTVYALLANFPAVLSISQFVVSKENSNPLKGSHELFLSTVFDAEFTLPDLIAKPIKPVKPVAEEYKGAAKSAYLVALDGWSDSLETFDTEFGEVNASISTLAKCLDRDDILRKYANLQRCISFLRSTLQADPLAFETQEVTDLEYLPSTVKKILIDAYQSKFASNPVMFIGASFISLTDINPTCGLDSIQGIDAIIAVKSTLTTPTDPKSKKLYDGYKFGFLGAEVMIEVLKLIYGKVNYVTFRNIENCLVSNGSTSKNGSTILANFKKLLVK